MAAFYLIFIRDDDTVIGVVISNEFNWLRIIKETRRRNMKNDGFEVRNGRDGEGRGWLVNHRASALSGTVIERSLVCRGASATATRNSRFKQRQCRYLSPSPVTRVRVRIITTYTFVHPGDNYCRPGLGV